MPVRRADLDQTSIYRKFLAYGAGGGARNLFGQQLGIGSFRILTVTTSSDRTETMLEALSLATRPSRQFLFTDHKMLAETPDVLTLPWLTGKGDHVRLID